MKLFYIYRTARKKLYKDFKNKKNHSTFLYGLPELKKQKFECIFSDLPYSKFNILNYLLKPLENFHQWLLNYSLGFKLHQAIVLWPQYQKSDVIVTTQDSAGLPFLVLKHLGIIKPKIVYITNGLSNALSKIRYKWVATYLKFALMKADAIVCYSKKEKNILDAFLGNKKKATFISLGVDINFFKIDVRKKKYTYDILAAGRDSFRDYKTFFEAVNNTQWNVVTACSPINIKGLEIPKNVTIVENASPHEMLNLYNISKLVVIPMKKTDKTQGQVVFMEAAALSKKILASNVSGLTTAYELKNYPNIELIEPENSKLLRNGIQKSLKKATKQSSKFRKTLSMNTYAQKLAKIIYNI